MIENVLNKFEAMADLTPVYRKVLRGNCYSCGFPEAVETAAVFSFPIFELMTKL